MWSLGRARLGGRLKEIHSEWVQGFAFYWSAFFSASIAIEWCEADYGLFEQRRVTIS